MAQKVFGGKIVLEGEQAYNKALKSIKTVQAELRSEMKLCTQEFKSNANSLTALTSKQGILTQQVEASQKKVDVYAKAVEDSTKKQEEAKKKLDELRASQTASDEELRNAEQDYQKASDKVSKYQTSLNNAQSELVGLKNDLNQTNKYVEEAEKSFDGCATSIDEFGNEIKDAEDETSRFGDVLKANLTSEAIISSVKFLADGIREIATAAIETGMEFEASMDNVAALTNATGAELDALTTKAKEMGETTIFSASESADAFGYMALAGWKTEQMLEGIEPVLNLAAAANMDLAQASDIVTDYLTAFGLSASDAGRFTDQLAYAMANSNTTVEMLGEAYKNSAATATSLGFAVEDVTAVLMTMANAGVKGSEAGTGLSAIMTRLATNTKGCADELSRYGVEVYDAQGNMNSLSDILGGLSRVWNDLSAQEQASLAKTIAGQQQFSKLQTIMAGVSESAQAGGQSFYDYADALRECDGTAANIANTMQDNLKGKLTILQSALDSLKISTYEVFDDALKDGVDGATTAVTKLNRSVTSGNLNVSLSKMADSLGRLLEKTINFAEDALPPVINGLSWLIDNVGMLTAGFVGYEVATNAATIAQWALNVAMDANPIGAITVAIEAAVAALAAFAYWMATDEGVMNEASESAKRLAEATESSNQATIDSMNARADARAELDNQADATNHLIDRMEELNSKTDLTASEQAELNSIVTQLNTSFPSLNLALDENGRITGRTTQEIRNQCAAYLDLYKVQAAQQDLIEISQELYEKEKQQAEIKAELASLEKEILETTGQSVGEWNNFADSLDNAYAALGFNRSELGNMVQQYNDLSVALADTDGQIEYLTNEFKDVSAYVGANTQAVSENAEAYAGMVDVLGTAASAYSDLSTEGMQAVTDLAEAVETSVSSQISAFDAWDEKQRVSKEELISNLASQIQGVRDWSTNMQLLAQRGISNGLLQELAKMGPEGYQYVQAFLDMTDDELRDYDQQFAEYVMIPSDVASEIAQNYADVASGAAGQLNTLNYDYGYSIGMFVGQGLISGIGAMKPQAAAAAAEMAGAVSSKFANTLQIKSPSRVFKKYGEYTADGFILGWQEGMEDIENVISETIPDVSMMASNSNGQLYDINTADSNTNITLDTRGIAEAVAFGASNANITLSIGQRDLARALKEMGVSFES